MRLQCIEQGHPLKGIELRGNGPNNALPHLLRKLDISYKAMDVRGRFHKRIHGDKDIPGPFQNL